MQCLVLNWPSVKDVLIIISLQSHNAPLAPAGQVADFRRSPRRVLALPKSMADLAAGLESRSCQFPPSALYRLCCHGRGPRRGRVLGKPGPIPFLAVPTAPRAHAWGKSWSSRNRETAKFQARVAATFALSAGCSQPPSPWEGSWKASSWDWTS